MSSFSCPHYDFATDQCHRLNTDCVPGRRGCVLMGKVSFLVPPEERVRAREEEKRRAGPGSSMSTAGRGRTRSSG
ncbi:MAG: hypothetical protein JNM65_09515 [Verrucomicrobiaceae bacterium]|nr:hypothetical protein [Verrucomicrobiaceae bacterium]